MHIREITIENVRRFGSGESRLHLELPPAGWIVVAGPNGSGKTTFLETLALAVSPSFSEDYARTHFTFLRKGESKGQSSATVVGDSDDRWENEVGAAEVRTSDYWIFERARGNQSGWMRQGREGDNERAFAGPWHANPQGWFAAGYGTYRAIRPGIIIDERWASEKTRESAFLTLFKEGAMLGHPIRWLMDLKFRSVDSTDGDEKRRARELGNLIVDFLNAGLLGKIRALGTDPSGLRVDDDGVALSIERLGNGFQALAAIVIDIIRHLHARFGELQVAYDEQNKPLIKNSGMVLIDEVEQHLHPQLQRQVGFWFRKHFPNIQFIVTTHSPFVCQAATPKGLILLPGDSTQPATIADDRLYQQVVYGGVDDALLSGLFGLHRTWSDESEERREQFARLETKVLSGKASSDERAKYAALKEQLPLTMSDDVNRATARLLQDLDLRR